jgi:hypothetical protein
MAQPRIRLNAQQTEDFTALCQVDAAKVRAVLEALEDYERPLLSAADLRAKAARIVGERAAGALVRQTIAFAIGIRRAAFSADIVDAISEALKDRQVDSAQLKAWERIKHTFWNLISHRHIKHAAKAFDLSYDYANIFEDARLITDLRPVFDDEHSALIGGIVRHVIRLSYSSIGELTTLSIVMDRKNIEDLREWCDEALKKEAALISYMLTPNPIEVITSREERDELQ